MKCSIENGDNTDEQPETDNRFDANLKKVENDLKELLKRFKGGIVLKSLEDIYQMHYSRNFPYKKLGLPSMESLICRVADKLVLANGLSSSISLFSLRYILRLCIASSSDCRLVFL